MEPTRFPIVWHPTRLTGRRTEELHQAVVDLGRLSGGRDTILEVDTP